MSAVFKSSINRREFIKRSTVSSLAAATLSFASGQRDQNKSGLWIVDSEPGARLSVQFMAKYYGFIKVRIFESKLLAIKHLYSVASQPAIVVTDFLGGEMRGDDFIKRARRASPKSTLILFSAVIGSFEDWKTVVGPRIAMPDFIVPKPEAAQFMELLRQLKTCTQNSYFHIS